MADLAAMLGEEVEVAAVDPDAMAEREIRPEAAKMRQMADGGASGAPPSELRLSLRFDEVHVHLGAVAAGGVEDRLEAGIAAPMKIGRRELEADADWIARAPALRGPFEEGHVVPDRGLRGHDLRTKVRRNVVRQARQESRVVLVDELVSIADHEGPGHAHADLAIGGDDAIHRLVPLALGSAQATLNVLHGGRAALEHLDRSIEGVEAVPDPPHAAKMGARVPAARTARPSSEASGRNGGGR